MMKIFYALFLLPIAIGAAETWEAALAKMPLKVRVSELNRTNCVSVLLGSFQENQTVKAIVFMPGATDEFYMFGRAQARLTNATPSILDAVSALTNQTWIRATFTAPLLLLHTDEDPLDVLFKIEHEGTAKKIQNAQLAPHLLFDDRDWNFIQPILKKGFKVDVRPWRHSYDSWHFYRHSFAGWNLNGWEALKAVALAGKTSFTVQRRRLLFEGDERVRATPKLDAFPRQTSHD